MKTSYFNGVKNYQWMPDNVRAAEGSEGGLVPQFQDPLNSFLSNPQRILKQEDIMRQTVGYNQQTTNDQEQQTGNKYHNNYCNPVSIEFLQGSNMNKDSYVGIIPLGIGTQCETKNLGVQLDCVSEFGTQYRSDFKQQTYLDIKDFYKR